MIIYLTDAQRDTFAACGLIVIDGAKGRCTCRQFWLFGGTPHAPDCPSLTLVAPEGWRILTEPCEHEHAHTIASSDPLAGDWQCPDCGADDGNPGDGRRVVTLTTTCTSCEGKAKNRYEHDPDEWEDCPHCIEGVVTLGRFTIPALWPVVKAVRGYWETQAEGATWVSVHAEREATGYLDQITYGSCIPAQAIKFILLGGILRREELMLDPLPHPGQFVARPEKVPE